MQEKQLSKLNEAFIYIAVCISLMVFAMAAFPQLGIEVNQNQILLLIIILILLLFRHFRVIEIPGLLKLSREVEEVRKETKAIRDSLQLLAISRSVSSAVVNINQMLSDTAEEAREIESEIPERTREPADEEYAMGIRRHIQEGQFVAAFAALRNSIETQLREILSIRGFEERRHRSLGMLLISARKLELLDSTLIEAISIVKNAANTILHSAPYEKTISMDQARNISELGIKTVYELQAVRNQLAHQDNTAVMG